MAFYFDFGQIISKFNHFFYTNGDLKNEDDLNLVSDSQLCFKSISIVSSEMVSSGIFSIWAILFLKLSFLVKHI